MTARESERLNFVVFLVDELRAGHTGFGGHDIVQTPNLDALAASGVTFDRAYVANPICMPNRATIATGLMPSAHGTRINGIALEPHAQTAARILRDGGWLTAAVGKIHHQNMIGWNGERDYLDTFMMDQFPALVDGEQGRPTDGDGVRANQPSGWDTWEDMSRHRRERVELPADYYGYDAVDLVVGHSDFATGQYFHWLRDHGVEPDDVRGRARAPYRYDGWNQVYQSALPEELYPTSYVTDKAIARLTVLAEQSQPFFLLCSYPDPHHPFTPPGRYYDMYRPSDIEPPDTFRDPHTRSTAHIKRLVGHRGIQSDDPFLTWAPTEDQYRNAAAAEFGMITMIDDGIRQVLEATARLGLEDTTVVIFTSDHGDMFGDHGLILKGFAHYDACVRVPLIVKGPGIIPRRISDLAGSIDIAPTIVDLAGRRPYYGMQGRSLAGVLGGSSDAIRDHVLIEEDELTGMPGLEGPQRMRTVITDDARLTVYTGTGQGELFDFRDDPQELENQYGDPAGRPLKQELTELLVESMVVHERAITRPKGPS